MLPRRQTGDIGTSLTTGWTLCRCIREWLYPKISVQKSSKLNYRCLLNAHQRIHDYVELWEDA
eukprot:6180565-Pleurochrysis_carterae.AAC.3